MKVKDITFGLYVSIHRWMTRNYEKTGVCERCKQEKETVWALKQGQKYEKKRECFLELCWKCHRIYDDTPEWRASISKVRTGTKVDGRPAVSAETRRKISEGKKGKPRPDVAARNRIIKRRKL